MANRSYAVSAPAGGRASNVHLADYMYRCLFPFRLLGVLLLVVLSSHAQSVEFVVSYGAYQIPGPYSISDSGTIVAGISAYPSSVSVSESGGVRVYSMNFTVYGLSGTSQASYENFNTVVSGTATFTQNGDLIWEGTSDTVGTSTGTGSIGTWVPLQGGTPAHWATASLSSGMSGGTALNMMNFFKGYFDWCIGSNVVPSNASWEFWLAGAQYTPGAGLPTNPTTNVDVGGGSSSGNNSGSGSTTNNTTNNTTVNNTAENVTNNYNTTNNDTTNNTTNNSTTNNNYYSGGGGGEGNMPDFSQGISTIPVDAPDVPHATNLSLALPSATGAPAPISISLGNVWNSDWGTTPALTITHDEIPYRETIRAFLLLILYTGWLVGIWYLLSR